MSEKIKVKIYQRPCSGKFDNPEECKFCTIEEISFSYNKFQCSKWTGDSVGTKYESKAEFDYRRIANTAEYTWDGVICKEFNESPDIYELFCPAKLCYLSRKAEIQSLVCEVDI